MGGGECRGLGMDTKKEVLRAMPAPGAIAARLVGGEIRNGHARRASSRERVVSGWHRAGPPPPTLPILHGRERRLPGASPPVPPSSVCRHHRRKPSLRLALAVNGQQGMEGEEEGEEGRGHRRVCGVGSWDGIRGACPRGEHRPSRGPMITAGGGSTSTPPPSSTARCDDPPPPLLSNTTGRVRLPRAPPRRWRKQRPRRPPQRPQRWTRRRRQVGGGNRGLSPAPLCDRP